MKKSSIAYIFIASVLILSLMIGIIIYTWPVKIESTYNGIMCRTGDSMPDYSEKMTITINGHYTKRLFSNNFFTGRFSIEGLDLVDNIDSSDVKLFFDKKGSGFLMYEIFGNGGFELINIGKIYANNKWTELFISIPDVVIESTTREKTTWSSTDGLVIAMPSNNRKEAIEVVNRILQNYWDNKVAQVW